MYFGAPNIECNVHNDNSLGFVDMASVSACSRSPVVQHGRT
jgi:hypothetical protein